MTTFKTFSNGEDVLDTRDLEAAITELENNIEEEYHAEGDEYQLAVLKEFRQDLIDNFGDSYLDGVTLVRHSYFRAYAQELAEDIGAIGRELQWPLTYIDWEAAIDALSMDYTRVNFDGVKYWGR